MISTAMPSSRCRSLSSCEDLRLDRHVERRRRLVGDQQRRAADQRHRDHRALPQAAGKLERVACRSARAGSGKPTSRSISAVCAHRLRRFDRVVQEQRLARSGRRSCAAATARASAPGRSSRCARRGSRGMPRRRGSSAREVDRRPRSTPDRRTGSGRCVMWPVARQDAHDRLAITDLPEPDSPTSATVVPGRMRKLTPSTARTVVSWTRNSIARSRTVSRSLMPAPSTAIRRRCVGPGAIRCRRPNSSAATGAMFSPFCTAAAAARRAMSTNPSSAESGGSCAPSGPRALEGQLHPAARPVDARRIVVEPDGLELRPRPTCAGAWCRTRHVARLRQHRRR